MLKNIAFHKSPERKHSKGLTLRYPSSNFTTSSNIQRPERQKATEWKKITVQETLFKQP